MKINGAALQTIKKGKKLLLTAKTDAENKKIKWASLNENVAVVDKNGNLAAKNIGVSVITAMDDNGDFDTTVVRVTA